MLGRFVGRDPVGYSAGANLASYGNGSPSNTADPTGALTIIPKVQAGFGCGETGLYQFDVALDNLAPCNGYLVQRVVVTCLLEKECLCTCDDLIADYYVFYEVKRIQQGTLAAVVTTDTSEHTIDGRGCGLRLSHATWKFYCDSDTGDLSIKWKIEQIHPPLGEWSHCGRAMSGKYLSADGDEAAESFWSKTPIEGPASRLAGAAFNCCVGNDRKWVLPLWFPFDNFGPGPIPLPGCMPSD